LFLLAKSQKKYQQIQTADTTQHMITVWANSQCQWCKASTGRPVWESYIAGCLPEHDM